MSEMRTFCWWRWRCKRAYVKVGREGLTYGILVLRELGAEVGEVRKEFVVWVDIDLRAEVLEDGLVELGLVDKQEGLVPVNQSVGEEYCRDWL